MKSQISLEASDPPPRKASNAPPLGSHKSDEIKQETNKQNKMKEKKGMT